MRRGLHPCTSTVCRMGLVCLRLGRMMMEVQCVQTWRCHSDESRPWWLADDREEGATRNVDPREEGALIVTAQVDSHADDVSSWGVPSSLPGPAIQP